MEHAQHDIEPRQALIAKLRAADEQTVFAALEGAYVHRPLTGTDELLELWNRMLDVLLGAPDS